MTAESGRAAAAADSIAKSEQAVQLGRQLTDLTASAAVQKAAIDTQQAITLEAYQRELGLDPRDSQNVLSQAIAEKNMLEPQLRAARAEYDRAASTDLLSNPIGYIFAQLKLPALAQKNNAIAYAMGRADDRMQEATQRFDERRRTVIAASADQIKELQLTQAKLDAQAAEMRQSEAEAALASKRAGEFLQRIQAANMIGDNQRQTIMGIAQLKEQEEARVERRQRMALIDEQRQLALDQKRSNAEQDARLDLRLAQVSKSLGMIEPMTIQRLRTLADGPEKNAWLLAALNGQYGETLYDSLRFYGDKASRVGVVKGGNAPVYEAYEQLRKSGLGYQSQAEMEAMKTGKKLKPEEARVQGFELYRNAVLNSAEGTTYSHDLSSRKWDSEYNPLKVPALQTADLLTRDPRFASLKDNLVAKALTTLAASTDVRGGAITSEQEQAALKSIYTRVRLREITAAKAAADIAAFYKTGTDINYSQTQYDTFGIPKPRAYLYSLELSGDRKKVDLFNAAELERAFQRAVVADRQPLGYSPIGGFR
jgi:hypothetical protein